MSRPKRPRPPDQRFHADQIEVYEPGRACRVAYERMAPMITMVAENLADGDWQLRKDLLQEATIAVWEMDASRFHGEDERYLRRSVAARMRLFMRAERRRAVSVAPAGSAPAKEKRARPILACTSNLAFTSSERSVRAAS